jgi:hypothetical protein
MLAALNLLPNPTWNELSSPREGDIVRVEHEDGFTYSIKLKVLSLNGDKITGKVCDISARGEGSITGGEILALKGQTFSFRREKIHEVF